MPQYLYQGRNQQNQKVSGRRQGSSAESVANQLAAEGIIPIEIKLAHRDLKGEFLTPLKERFKDTKVSREEMLIFCRQMYALTKAGIPIVTALTRVAESSHNKYFAECLMGVAGHISAGQDFSAALQHYPKLFTLPIIRLVEVGSATGRLDNAFQQISEYLQVEQNAIKKIRTVLRYPAIVLTSIIAAMVVINIFVIPSFAKLFATFQAKLPLPTQILINVSAFFVDNWPFLLVGAGASAIAIAMFLKTPQGKGYWGKYQLKLPIIGRILRSILLARFARTFAIVMQAGVQMTQALALVAEAVNNVYAKQKILEMSQLINQGESLTRAATLVNLFSPLVLQMLAIGEEAGELNRMLQEVNDYYEAEVEYEIKKLADAIEPILLVFVAAMVLILALGVFLPMWDMISFVK